VTLEEAIQIADEFLEPTRAGDARPPSFEQRSAMRKIVRALKTSREQSKVVIMAVENAANLVERA
jgi:hypothetical protein